MWKSTYGVGRIGLLLKCMHRVVYRVGRQMMGYIIGLLPGFFNESLHIVLGQSTIGWGLE